MTNELASLVPTSTYAGQQQSFCYLATVEAPSTVFHSVRARFISGAHHNLVLSKVNYLEVYDILGNGLEAKLRIPLNGRITCLKCLPAGGRDAVTDTLFVATEREQFCILAYDAPRSTVVSVSHGSVHDRACRPIERGQLVVACGAAVVMHLVQGLMTIIPLEAAGGVGAIGGKRSAIAAAAPRHSAHQARIEELQVLDIAIMANGGTLVLLSENYSGGRRLSTYTLGGGDKRLMPGSWAFDELEMDSHTLISVPYPRSGVLVVADESILYYNPERKLRCSMAMKPNRIVCHCQIDDDGYRFLLGDTDGGLHVLILSCAEGSSDVASLQLEYLGTTSIPSTLTYLDDGYVFVGSQYGDSQVIKLAGSRLPDGSFVEIIDRFKSLGPIVDFALVDIEKIGQSSVVACSGAYKEGTLRVIRKGSNLSVESYVQPADWSISGIFSLEGRGSLCVTDPFRTHVIKIANDGSMGELDAFENFDLAQPSLLAHEYRNCVVQVTSKQIIISGAESKVISVQGPHEVFTQAAAYGDLLVVASNQCLLRSLELSTCAKTAPVITSCPVQVSAMCVLSVDGKSLHVVLAGWNDSHLRLLDLQSGTVSVTSVRTANAGLVRSMTVHVLEDIPYLFIGYGDGLLEIYRVAPTDLAPSLEFSPASTSAIVIGNEPVSLSLVKPTASPSPETPPRPLLFAISSRPFLVNSIRGKIHLSLTNFRNTQAICAIGSNVVVAKDDGIYFCTLDIDSRSALHQQSHPLGETAIRIIHCSAARAYALITSDQPACEVSLPASSEAPSVRYHSHVRLLDQDTFALLDTFTLPPGEGGHSLTLTFLVPQGSDAIVVGTFIRGPNNEEPREGRLLTFTVTPSGRKLSLISQTTVPGAVYSINPIDSHRLVATVNGMTCLYGWNRSDNVITEDGAVAAGSTGSFAWHHLHSQYGQILGIKSSALGTLVAVGDLMKSVNILSVDITTGRLVEVGRDHEPHWMTELAFVDKSSILGADNLGNLFVLARDPASERLFAPSAIPKWSLLTMAGMHLGETVNKIAPGGLFRTQDTVGTMGTLQLSNPMLLATTAGSLYQFGQLPALEGAILATLQENLRKLITPIGHFEHSDWRTMVTERKTPRSQIPGFLDGDLLGRFLELPDRLQRIAVEGGGSQECVPTGADVSVVMQMIESIIAAHQ